jgi:hypothetical protein
MIFSFLLPSSTLQYPSAGADKETGEDADILVLARGGLILVTWAQ